MGMFDYVRCKALLPDGYTATTFQTKDLISRLATYEITESGQLLMVNDGYGEGDLACPKIVDFHGWMNFYGHDEAGVWHEYHAKFTDGQLVKLVLAQAMLYGNETTI